MKIKIKTDEPVAKKKMSGRTKVILVFSAVILFFASFFALYLYHASKNVAITTREMKELMKDHPEIKMEVKDATSDSATLIVTKDFEETIITSGSVFSLYERDLGGWNQVAPLNFNTGSTVEGSYMITIDGTDPKEIPLNIKDRFGSLPKGEYVIRKTFSIVSEENMGKGLYVYSRFEVK